jgi:hypothetical protein
MAFMRNVALLLAIALFTSATLISCGNSSSSSPATATEPSAQFLTGTQSNRFAGFGSEAPSDVREAASKVLEENFEARAQADFASQCQTLNSKTVESIAAPARGTKAAMQCPTALQKLAEPLAETKATRADTLGGPIDAMRVQGNRGFALYHGTDDIDYAVRMEKENGVWKVATILARKIGATKTAEKPRG